MNSDKYQERINAAIDKAVAEGRDPYIAGMDERIAIKREERDQRPFIGYTCLHCGGGHLGVNCDDRFGL